MPVDDSMAQVLGMAAGQLQKVAGQMYEQAQKQQDDIRAVEFAKLKGEVDASFNEFYMAESENPDYEGMKERGKAFTSERKQAILEGIKDKQVRMAMEKYLATKGPAMDLDMSKLYLAKQTDHRNAVFGQAYEQAVLNNDRTGLASLVEGATWLDETKRQALLSKGGKEISWNTALKDMRSNLDGWTFDGEKYSGLDEQQVIQLKDQHETLLDRRGREIEKAKRERYEKTDDKLWGVYFGGGRVSKAELAGMVKSGDLSMEGAARWDASFTSRQEAAASRAERLRDRAIKDKVEKMNPYEADIYLFSQDTGLTTAQINTNYEKYYALYDKTGKDSVLMDAIGNGEISQNMAHRIKANVSELAGRKNAAFRIKYGKTRKAISDNLVAMGLDASNLGNALAEFEMVADPNIMTMDDIDKVGRDIELRYLKGSGLPTQNWMGLDTNLGKRVNTLEALPRLSAQDLIASVESAVPVEPGGRPGLQ
jgi:hypothetical protein